jgi:acetolactate synthase small subunit
MAQYFALRFESPTSLVIALVKNKSRLHATMGIFPSRAFNPSSLLVLNYRGMGVAVFRKQCVD